MVNVEAMARQAGLSAGLEGVFRKVQALEQKYAQRDKDARNIKLIRSNNWSALAPQSFNEDYPEPIVANLIDNFCRDFGASVAPLPSFNCSTGMLSDKAKKAAAKRTRIVNHYIEVSNLGPHMLEGGDGYGAYGAVVA